jgi:hypothetical protein
VLPEGTVTSTVLAFWPALAVTPPIPTDFDVITSRADGDGELGLARGLYVTSIYKVLVWLERDVVLVIDTMGSVFCPWVLVEARDDEIPRNTFAAATVTYEGSFIRRRITSDSVHRRNIRPRRRRREHHEEQRHRRPHHFCFMFHLIHIWLYYN